MSARTPFEIKHTIGLARAQTPSRSNPAPMFTPNSRNPLYLDLAPRQQGSLGPENAALGLNNNKPLPTDGLLLQNNNRTVSHDVSSGNLLQVAASMSRTFSSAPAQRILNQPRPKQTVEGEAPPNRIVTPSPRYPINREATMLHTADDGFRTRALHSRTHTPELPPECSLGLSASHIPCDEHTTSVRQQPSPDLTTHSSSDGQLPAEVSFKTPGSHPLESPRVGLQQIFTQAYDADDYQRYHTQHMLSNSRKRSHEYPSQTQAKRQRTVHQPNTETQPRTNPGHYAPTSAGVESLSIPGAALRTQSSNGSHQSILSQILECDSDQLVRKEMEHFNNRINIWTAASDEDWREGAEELRQRFNVMLNKAQEHMEKKQELVAKLDGRIDAHKRLLNDREQALITAKENLVNESQNVLGGDSRGRAD